MSIMKYFSKRTVDPSQNPPLANASPSLANASPTITKASSSLACASPSLTRSQQAAFSTASPQITNTLRARINASPTLAYTPPTTKNFNTSVISEAGTDQQASTTASLAFYNECLSATLQPGTYFQLTSQTISSLDILESKNGTADQRSGRANTSVYSVLNDCRTAAGKRLLELWLKNPLMNKELIDLRLDIVDFFTQNTELRNCCHERELRRIPDVMRIAYLMTTKSGCKIEDLVKVFKAHEALVSILNEFERADESDIGDESPFPTSVLKLINKTKLCCKNLRPFVDLVDEYIYVDKVDAEGQYIIKPGSDGDMGRVYVELETIVSSARQQMVFVAEEVGLEADKTIKLEIDKDKGFAFKVTRQKEQLIRDNKEYQQVNTVKKDGYRFGNKALRKLSDKYVSAKSEYHSMSTDVVKEVLSKVAEYQSEVQDVSLIIAILDVYTTLAAAAVQGNYVRPEILSSNQGKIKIDSMRHPCLENQPDIENYVPNDVLLSKAGKKFYIITGPNMGGKSTYIKGVAIAVIMAQCGSMIAAESALISVVDNVYTRVGAGDRQMEGISTFMEEMIDMSYILEKATENSLVIIDELGRGTSTFDGFGLSWAISKKMACDIKCYTLFATHFHEITELDKVCPTVGNLHVKAFCDDDRLVMLFNIENGVSKQSYGINVAKFTRFPEHIVAKAQAKLDEYELLPGFNSIEESKKFLIEIKKDLQV